MRCIEIDIYRMECHSFKRLTLTWDVLKSITQIEFMFQAHRLTLTWDVLKSHVQRSCLQCRLRLTLTWDVLKCCLVIATRKE